MANHFIFNTGYLFTFGGFSRNFEASSKDFREDWFNEKFQPIG